MASLTKNATRTPHVDAPALTRRGEKWRLLWRFNGRQQSATFASTEIGEIARQLLATYKRRITRDGLYARVSEVIGTEADPTAAPVDAPVMFGDVATEWLANKEIEVRENTYKAYRVAVTHQLMPHFQVPITDITTQSVMAWRNAQVKERKYSTRSVSNQLMILKGILTSALGTHLTENVAKKVRYPSAKRPEQVFLSSQEYAFLRLYLPGVYRAVADLAVHTGCRIGELLALRVRDVNFTVSGAVVTVTKSARSDGEDGDTKSETSVRSVAVSPSMTALLARLCDSRPGHAHLFTEDGRILTAARVGREFRRGVVAAMRCKEHPPEKTATPSGRMRIAPDAVSTCECGTRLQQRPRFHDLRHTHAAWLVDLGWALDEIQTRLGHASILTTRAHYHHRYARDHGPRLAALDVYETNAYTPRVAIVAEVVEPAPVLAIAA